jgi:hypothetical protein
MELNKIERLVEKYFDGETSVEEKELRKYCFNWRGVSFNAV